MKRVGHKKYKNSNYNSNNDYDANSFNGSFGMVNNDGQVPTEEGPYNYLGYEFTTQQGKGNANDACEAASLKMALSHFGIGLDESLNDMVDNIPRSKNPEKGYSKDPYRWGSGASLYPKALLKVAQSYGATSSYIIDDYYRHGKGLYGRRASAQAFINAITNGYPVVFEGGNQMQNGVRTKRSGYNGYRSDHVMLLYGYQDGIFYWTDPEHLYINSGTSTVKQFMNIINAGVRGPRAVAIGV